MITREERIAELAAILPMFIGILLDGSEITTEIKLNFSEEKTLMFLHQNEGCPMTTYCKKVGLTKGSFTSVVDHLEKKGLVERVSVCNDRRKQALILTEEGKRVAKKIDSYYSNFVSQKITKLEEEDTIKLLEALETINNTIDKLK